MANRNSPQSPPLQDQVPNQMKIGVKVPLDPDMTELELVPSPVAGDDGSQNFLKFFYQVDAEALEELAKVTNFMMDGIGFSVEEPEITSNFLYIHLIVHKNKRAKRILPYTTVNIEQLKVLITGVCILTNYQKTQWAERFDKWPPLTLRVQLKWLVESGGFLEEK